MNNEIYVDIGEKFNVAQPRTFIPVEGLWPAMPRAYDLSAGLQGYTFPFAEVEENAGVGIQSLIEGLVAQTADLSLLAIAPNNDSLYENVIIPQIINAQLEISAATKVLLPEVGYPVVAWSADKLHGTLVEADYFHLIAKGSILPKSIGAVYIDLPGTFWGARYDAAKTRAWIEENPHVLFIVDQANLGFFTDKLKEDQYDVTKNVLHHPRIIVTNTTTKRFIGTRLLAWAWASPQLQTDLIIDSMNHIDIVKAVQIFHPVNKEIAAMEAAKVTAHRQILLDLLVQTYSENVVIDAKSAQNHNLIINVGAFGYNSAWDMAGELAVGRNGARPIGVKPTSYYGAPDNEFLDKYIYVAMPIDQAVFGELKKALGV